MNFLIINMSVSQPSQGTGQARTSHPQFLAGLRAKELTPNDSRGLLLIEQQKTSQEVITSRGLLETGTMGQGSESMGVRAGPAFLPDE
ncbi:hypothetical protein PoB_001055200 [Plakobranchus ocellatus]|uniref:Uncharacterized protein n=1 Tax=Plakobranchus ocellatus TaxID=259542 RepID=A0AAV3YM91_9GAST|nr:hypothetical protein PoB_001055200 [Plakobranchus ocellatus]